MYLRFVVATLIGLALLSACTEDRGPSEHPALPTAATAPGVTTDAKLPLRTPLQSDNARATPAQVDGPVIDPTVPPDTPIPTPTVAREPSVTPASLAAPVSATQGSTPVSATATHVPKASATPSVPTPTPTSNPVPTPTLDIAQQIARGKRLVERNNCLGCHSIDGQAYSAPTFSGLFGDLRQLEGGGTATADEQYLWESIKRPNEKIVQGYFVDAMPTVFFSDAEANAMVEYIKSLE